ncbi:hypothetical protein FE251_02375 [Georgenia wutianyii]|uniref:Bacterial spore germination immunoglobulin-like domain-containing protein n=1 Tax=Georgenia wutianyii TaxID=2585135 RepID=A0ABX5VIZ5_9MICO|nr:hypothetical protein [Georgenia wutianyii]QDB78349.1 hypothetical protein FE251_02375 [Georgenia wutianyii]
MDRRLASLVSGAALVGVLLGCSQPPTVQAGTSGACEAPHVRAERLEVRPDESLRVTGTAFLDSCDDTVSPGEPSPQDAPLEDIEVLWRQGGEDVVLGTVDAGDDGTFELAVTVPVAAVPGEADLGARFVGTMYADGYVAEGDTVEVLGE